MSVYARIQDDIVWELFETDGDITKIFPPELIWVNVDHIQGISYGWGAVEVNGVWEFTPYVAPLPTPEQVLASQSVKLQGLIQLSVSQKTALLNRISTLQDAIDNIGIEGMEDFAATDEEQLEFAKRKSQLVQWKNYAILLGRVTSQAGWPPDVVWPKQPAEGMDLSVSSL